MAGERLPVVGGDNNVWGALLNAFLSIVIDTDGTLKPSVVGSANIDATQIAAIRAVIDVYSTTESDTGDTGSESGATAAAQALVDDLSGVTDAATARSNLDVNSTGEITTALALYLLKTGGSLSNFLTLHADPTSALHAATKQYVDSGGGQVTGGDSHDHDGGDGAQIPAGGLATNSVTQVKIANDAVGQAELKTSTVAEVSTSAVHTKLTLPGGSYGFYPQIKMLNTDTELWIAQMVSIQDADGGPITQAGWTSYATVIALGIGIASSSTIYAQQRYIIASPPYKLGNKTWGHFLYLLINSTGDVISSYQAEDPPYAYNGPEFNPKDSIERIQAVPHPFVDYWSKDPIADGLEIVLVDLRNMDIAKWRDDNAKVGKGMLEDLSGINKRGKILPFSSFGVPNISGYTDKVKIRVGV